MKINLEGKVVLVTGGASGMGRASAVAFARAGAKVAICDVNGQGGEETLGLVLAAGGDAFFSACDVSAAAQVEALVNQTVKKFGRLDCAANIAGIEGKWGDHIADASEENFDRVIGVNLKGVWLCMKYEIAQMLKQGGGGLIVNLASAAGLVGNPGSASYGASKHGVVGLTKTGALEYARQKIRVNAVCPGAIETPMLSRIFEVIPNTGARMADIEPVGRLGTADEIAAAVLWLCSDESSFVTGAALAVDGGLTAM
jgi:NAD(P)-dependent dehydrogenase (short-subunit alcohol dehydrogenase family)